MSGGATDLVAGEVTERLVAHALTWRAEAMPVGARRAARIFILDTLAVGLAGAASPAARAVLSAARQWGGPAVAGGAHVWGVGVRLPAPSAAFVNAFQIHCQEFDCVHEGAVVHPMATVMAALLAECEAAAEATVRGPVAGRELVSAVIVAVDIAAGLGCMANAPLRFFRPATAGVFGATLGVARLRGFDQATARSAAGFALAFCSGSMQAHIEGSPALAVQVANAARASLMACDLAGQGLAGPGASLDGPYGYLPLFEVDYDPFAVLAGLGGRAAIEDVSHKPFPTGRAAHGGIVLARRLYERGLRAGDVERLTLTGPPLIARLVGRPYTEPMPASYARLCYPYLAARTLLAGEVGLDDFDSRRIADPDAAAFAARVSVASDGSDNPAAFTPQRLVARLKDGSEIEERATSLLGSPAAPLSDEERFSKAFACARYALGTAGEELMRQVIERVEALESETDAGALAQLVSIPRKLER